MKFFKQSAAFVLGFMLMAGSAFAQGQMQQQQMQQSQPDSISDEDLQKFAAVTQEVNEKIDDEISSLLSDKEMSPERFEEIMMTQNNPQQAGDSADVTEQEQETMDEVQPKLMEVQQQEVMTAMENNGLEPQRFQSIVQALQSDPEVVERYREIVKEEEAENAEN
ncbi:MAG: DUF4168 domain-containing protein [Bacteroidota bacterium]